MCWLHVPVQIFFILRSSRILVSICYRTTTNQLIYDSKKRKKLAGYAHLYWCSVRVSSPMADAKLSILRKKLSHPKKRAIEALDSQSHSHMHNPTSFFSDLLSYINQFCCRTIANRHYYMTGWQKKIWSGTCKQHIVSRPNFFLPSHRIALMS